MPLTGEAVWADVLNPHDLYDFDEVNENILLDLPIDGQTRPVLVHPGRDGFMFVIDRRTGQIYSADKYDDQTSIERFDLKTGRPVMNEAQKPLLGKNISSILSCLTGREGLAAHGLFATDASAVHPASAPVHGLQDQRGRLYRRHALRRRDRGHVCRRRRLSRRICGLGCAHAPESPGQSTRSFRCGQEPW